MILLELAEQIGLKPKKVGSTDGGEYKCPCPECGGRKRFVIHPNKQQRNCVGSYWCRDCKVHGDAIQFCIDFLKLPFKDAVARVGGVVPNKQNFFLPLVPIPQETLFEAIEMPPAIWMEMAALFVEASSKNIFERKEQRAWLANRGIPFEAVERYQIGWNPEPVSRKKADWGLEEEKKGGESSTKLFLPRGIVIPTIDTSGVVRIKIRNTDYDPTNEGSKKYLAVTGSMKGFNLIGKTKNDVMLVVESELDALALDFACGDFAFAVSIGSNTKNPDSFTNYLARRVTHLLVCYDNDEGGLAMWKKWKMLYPHAKAYPTPIGKDVGEAVAEGLNLREWVREAL